MEVIICFAWDLHCTPACTAYQQQHKVLQIWVHAAVFALHGCARNWNAGNLTTLEKTHH